MKTCERCQREKVIEVLIDDSMDVCGHTFTTQMPATRCLACQHPLAHAAVVSAHQARRLLGRRPDCVDALIWREAKNCRADRH